MSRTGLNKWAPNDTEKEWPERKEDRQEPRQGRCELRLNPSFKCLLSAEPRGVSSSVYTCHSCSLLSWSVQPIQHYLLFPASFSKLSGPCHPCERNKALDSSLRLHFCLPTASHLLQVKRGHAEFLCWTSLSLGCLCQRSYQLPQRLKCQHSHQCLW